MTLANQEMNQPYKVISIKEEPLAEGLYSLGVFPGVELKVLRTSWSGNIMQVKLGGSSISIRKQEAEFINVERSE